MKINLVTDNPDITHIKLSGRVDLNSISGQDKDFIDKVTEPKKPALIDLSGVEYMASIGLRMLIAAAKPLNEYNAKMVLFNPNPHIEEVLKTSAFHRIMPIEHDYEKALEDLKSN